MPLSPQHLTLGSRAASSTNSAILSPIWDQRITDSSCSELGAQDTPQLLITDTIVCSGVCKAALRAFVNIKPYVLDMG